MSAWNARFTARANKPATTFFQERTFPNVHKIDAYLWRIDEFADLFAA